VAAAAATIEALQAIVCQPHGLSERDTLICLASVLGTGVGYESAADAVAAAKDLGLPALSERDLQTLTRYCLGRVS
jgi:hypothetical protein